VKVQILRVVWNLLDTLEWESNRDEEKVLSFNFCVLIDDFFTLSPLLKSRAFEQSARQVLTQLTKRLRRRGSAKVASPKIFRRWTCRSFASRATKALSSKSRQDRDMGATRAHP